MPGEPMTRRGRASRERIVERAAELFAERGIAATSVDEVLAAAGAGKGQFYHYFRGRDELERMRQRGELRADAPPGVLATRLLASIEGGMVLSQARKDITSLRIAVDAGLAQVRAYLNLVCTKPSISC